MGKITGFLEFERLQEAAEEAKSRVRHFREFIHRLPDDAASRQGARCMDCGIPFCQTGCPVNNIIPDWNDLVYRGDWKRALDVLQSTNNFPEFTGRICPAPCEAACTLNINDDPVGIKSIEHAIIDKGWEMGWVVPRPATRRTGRRVAVVGSGPAGLACAQQLARVGHDVTVFEKNDRVGGLLRYGIPDFKLEKRHIERRLEQMRAEGVRFRTGVRIGRPTADADAAPPVLDLSRERIDAEVLLADYDAVVLAAGAEHPRDLPVPGRSLEGVHFAMEFLPQQNRVVAGDAVDAQIHARGRRVVVIGGGDTGSDCVGTSNRQGALSVTQLELMPQPPLHERRELTWPYWPYKLHLVVARGRLRARLGGGHEGLRRGCARTRACAARDAAGVGCRSRRRPDAHARGRGQRIRDPGRSRVAGDGLRLAARLAARGLRRRARPAGQRARAHRRRGQLSHERREGVRGGRRTARAVARRLGDSRGKAVRAGGRRVSDGGECVAAVNVRCVDVRKVGAGKGVGRVPRARECAAPASRGCPAMLAAPAGAA